ncbi:hypothetical protein STSP2_03251 [Anaerohalosphaera lusitana]|uniref:Hyphally-regulated cell wall protein N-terminal domain-containing protein n=1 Tax=Anaerohalosphaera lusitana TaxID=1936003 RepID=A0A1U9NQ66_9BACT|nr:hypothetical protein [Anaerohalosphaera lusitana]AQT70049.1 hypothetical protein STSP2_03251 [Anaerohalosphaera lusitana]
MENLRLAFVLLMGLVPFAFSGPGDYVDFNDGGEHVIDYHVQYSDEILDCSVRVDNDVNNVPGTKIIVESGARIDHRLYLYNNSLANINAGDVWGGLVTYDHSELIVSGGYFDGQHFFHDNSKVTFNGGVFSVNPNVAIWTMHNCETIINDGTFHALFHRDHSSLIVNGGQMNGTILEDDSSVKINQGKIGSIDCKQRGKALVMGGDIGACYTNEYSKLVILVPFQLSKFRFC